jgi:hypothetical protein
VLPDVDDRALDLLEKQLGRYQQIVSRLAGNSVQVKTWCCTATAALAAIAIERSRPELFAVALLLVGAFFYLDAYYLVLERHFRNASTDLAERVITGVSFEWRELVVITPTQDAAASWRRIARCGGSSPTSVIYGVLAAAAVLGLVLGPT